MECNKSYLYLFPPNCCFFTNNDNNKISGRHFFKLFVTIFSDFCGCLTTCERLYFVIVIIILNKVLWVWTQFVPIELNGLKRSLSHWWLFVTGGGGGGLVICLSLCFDSFWRLPRRSGNWIVGRAGGGEKTADRAADIPKAGREPLCNNTIVINETGLFFSSSSSFSFSSSCLRGRLLIIPLTTSPLWGPGSDVFSCFSVSRWRSPRARYSRFIDDFSRPFGSDIKTFINTFDVKHFAVAQHVVQTASFLARAVFLHGVSSEGPERLGEQNKCGVRLESLWARRVIAQSSSRNTDEVRLPHVKYGCGELYCKIGW